MHAQPAEAAEGQLHPPGIFQSFEIGLSDMVNQALWSLESISLVFQSLKIVSNEGLVLRILESNS